MPLTKGQQLCVDTLDRPLVVAAGAGSGKTFTLTKRIVNAIRTRQVNDIGEVCAITFTRKAASELKSRLKGELRACNLIDQALKVDEAWVSTIHGMCARILRAHAIELGLDPSFAVAEGALVEEYLAQAVDSVLLQAQCDESSARLDALFEEYPARSFSGYGVSVEGMLTSLVTAASSQRDGVDSFVLPGLTVRPQHAVELAVGVVEEMLDRAAREKPSAKRDEWMALAEAGLADARTALGRGVESAAEALSVMAPFKFAKTFGSKEFKAHVDEARGVFGAYVMEVRLGAANEHLETLVSLARRALEEFKRLKKANGVLDNNDLLVEAARALEEHPSIAARYANKFKLVMVDEFQDTDQMQVDMIKRLSGEGAARLCTVGDAQQSIYRFRGADVSVYRRHLEYVRNRRDDSVVQLAENFRSHADVLSFVDRIFERPGMFGDEFMSLSHGRDEGRVPKSFGQLRRRVVVQHTSRPYRGVPAGEACQVAARRIAAEFADLTKAGHSAGEMVVLLGRMTNAGVYAQELRDAGLACVISGGSVFAGTPEAGVVRELVRVIANPDETQSLFNVLVSPLFSLSAGDLLEVGRFDGFWKAALAPNQDASAFSPQLICALQVMGAARRAAGVEPVSRIVERVVTDSGWLTRLQRGGAEGLASAGNVYKAIRMVRRMEQEGACGPVSVMRGFEETLAVSKEAPGALSVSGGNYVRIMTIHASKGLEFPFVAVAEVPENRAPASRLLETALAGKVYLSLDLSRTAEESGSVSLDDMLPYVLGEVAGEQELAEAVMEEAGALHRRLAMREYMAAGDEEEAKRLLYVAITRAREAIIVSSLGMRTKQDPLGIPKSALAGVFEALDALGAPLGEGAVNVEFGGSTPASVEFLELQPDEGEGEPGEERLEEASREPFFVPAFEQRAGRPREAYQPLHEGVFSYSSISDAAHGGTLLSRLADAYAVGADETDPSGEAGLAVGADVADGGSSADEVGPIGRLHSNERLKYDALLQDAMNDEEGGRGLNAVSFDQDRATDLGTAFHRLAQHAVLFREANGGLAMPPDERVEALMRACRLDEAQRSRLSQALARWFGCELAHDMAGLPWLQAEAPFFIAVPRGESTPVFLEGEIDLLGFDEGRAHARVVDYKTGGHGDETADALKRKHVLQASCYAYAVLLQGAKSVDVDFVRVERPRKGDPNEPQCVRYHFEEGDLPQLEHAILEARGASPS